MLHTLNRRRGSAASVVVVVVLLALVAGGLWYFVLRSTPEKTVTAMLEAARAGDEALMTDYLTEASAGREGMVIAMTRRLAGSGAGEPEYSVGEAAIAETTATVPVEFPLGDTIATLTGRDTITIPYVLHREGRVWLVDTAETQEEAARQLAGGLFGILRQFFLPDRPPGAPDMPGDRHI